VQAHDFTSLSSEISTLESYFCNRDHYSMRSYYLARSHYLVESYSIEEEDIDLEGIIDIIAR
jgi:hypothetical protein